VNPGTPEARSADRGIELIGGLPVHESFPDPNTPDGSGRVFIQKNLFDLKTFSDTAAFTAPIEDESSLTELAEAVSTRVERGRAELQARLLECPDERTASIEARVERVQLCRLLASLEMYAGRLDEAAHWISAALEVCKTPAIDAETRAELIAVAGLIALRKGELANCIDCIGPSSCLFPIAPEAVHQNPSGSRDAMRYFSSYLAEWPGDLRVRWLLNIAAMTLGEYPAGVPDAFRIAIPDSAPSEGLPRLRNVAGPAGIQSRGPGLAGGSIFDDFDGDGDADIIASSLDVDRGLSYFRNRGDGTFADCSLGSGLENQVYALNLTRTDIDNDGFLDLLLLRGGWENPMRMSLLRNRGDGTFEDVSTGSGLEEPIASESAAWGDFDNDGLLDVYVCGEFRAESMDLRNMCRLYRNLGGGKFRDVAQEAGVVNGRLAKAARWGDFDRDGRLDLFVSNMGDDEKARFYRNIGDGTFRDAASELGITGAPRGFTSLFLDYDNDGWTDLYVSEYKSSLAEVVASRMGLPIARELHPHLYKNLEGKGFREVSTEVGLGRPLPTMSLNCGDLDNDGYLDLHLGIGYMSFAGLVPDRTLRNVEGHRFDDVTTATGTGHLQKGHGISFADWDSDGDVDLFAVQGGGYPGDKAYSVLFENPGTSNHSLQFRLKGKSTNRLAIGASLAIEVGLPDRRKRTIHRVIGTNGSFGGNSLVQTVGIGEATKVTRVRVFWPTSGTTQEFQDLESNRLYEIEEFATAAKPVARTPARSTEAESSRAAPNSRADERTDG
jgi:hypothetical protein